MKEPRRRKRSERITLINHNPENQIVVEGIGDITFTKIYSEKNNELVILTLRIKDYSISLDLNSKPFEELLSWAGYHKAPNAE